MRVRGENEVMDVWDRDGLLHTDRCDHTTTIVGAIKQVREDVNGSHGVREIRHNLGAGTCAGSPCSGARYSGHDQDRTAKNFATAAIAS